MRKVKRLFFKTQVKLNSKGKSLAVRLTKWTGKSRENIHPKHLVLNDNRSAWYLQYIDSKHKVLDLGCGNGIHAVKTAKHGCREIVATDYNEKQLKIGTNLAKRQGLKNIRFILSDLSDKLVLESNYFDRILLLDVIEHLNKRQDILREIRRVLKDDGLLILSAPNAETSWKKRLKNAGLPYYTDPDHKIEYSWVSLLEELENGGFAVRGEPDVIVYDTPLAGLIDVVGGISLTAYRILGNWKVRRLKKYPAETTGWRVVCVKTDRGRKTGDGEGREGLSFLRTRESRVPWSILCAHALTRLRFHGGQWPADRGHSEEPFALLKGKL